MCFSASSKVFIQINDKYEFSYTYLFIPLSSICVDINECKTHKDNCDRKTSTCLNTVGSFTCKCKAGYEKNSKGVCEGQIIVY